MKIKALPVDFAMNARGLGAHVIECKTYDDFVGAFKESKKIDRTTVPELDEIVASFSEIQSTMDKADAGLNPLGLAANVVPFGLNPSEIEQGKTHFEQILERAVGTLRNAMTVFNYANENTQRLRKVQDNAEEFDDLTDERELDFTSRLIEIFGRPYEEDIGPGGT